MTEEKEALSLSEYVMACDERGTTRWPSNTKTWSIGGVIFKKNEYQNLVTSWNKIKLVLCDDISSELKWSCFFPGKHQEKINNPLLSEDPVEWRLQAQWAIDQIFSNTTALPVGAYTRKDQASDAVFIIQPDGRKVLDIETAWVDILAQFALFLKEKQTTGEVWFDNLGSEKEQLRHQESWKQLRDGPWPVNPNNQRLLHLISPELTFFDSKNEPIIQVADFISGIIWAASEGDYLFLRNSLERFMVNGRRTYRLLKVT